MKKLAIILAVILASCSHGPNTVEHTTGDGFEMINYFNPGYSEKEGTIIYNYKNNTILVKRDSAYKLDGVSYHTMSVRVWTVSPAKKDSVITINNNLFH